MQEQNNSSKGSTTRLALCAAAAAGLVYAAEKLCREGDWPLWDKYGPWILENKVLVTALVAAALYGASLVLWPGEGSPGGEDGPEGFQPCL